MLLPASTSVGGGGQDAVRVRRVGGGAGAQTGGFQRQGSSMIASGSFRLPVTSHGLQGFSREWGRRGLTHIYVIANAFNQAIGDLIEYLVDCFPVGREEASCIHTGSWGLISWISCMATTMRLNCYAFIQLPSHKFNQFPHVHSPFAPSLLPYSFGGHCSSLLSLSFWGLHLLMMSSGRCASATTAVALSTS